MWQHATQDRGTVKVPREESPFNRRARDTPHQTTRHAYAFSQLRHRPAKTPATFDLTSCSTVSKYATTASDFHRPNAMMSSRVTPLSLRNWAPPLRKLFDV